MKRCSHRDCDEVFDERLSIRTVRRYCSDECRKAEFYKAGKDAAYAARGVRFVEQPRVEPYGRVAVFEDMYGNRWDLIQPVRR